MKYRQENKGHLVKKVTKMREELEDMEELLKQCMDDEADDYSYDDFDYSDDDRRMRRTERMMLNRRNRRI